MQSILVEKPYQFVPPHRGDWWPACIQYFDLFSPYLRKNEGVFTHEVRHVERLKESLKAGHGIMIAPNHPRTADPLVMGYLTRAAGCNVFAMASWHLFNRSRFMSFAIHKMGAFSINREGVDRQAINTAIDILDEAKRPLIVFPEGASTRTNDKLHALLDGVAFMARAAAKKRAKREGGKVVIHPVAIKYLFQGDLVKAADAVLSEIEQRISWRPRRSRSLIDRISKVGVALLSLKEMEHFGQPQTGTLAERLARLIDRLLGPLEQEWFGAVQSGGVVPRVKALRMKIMPAMIGGDIPPAERERRWDQLHDIYLAQQVSCYPPDYLTSRPSVDRLLETIERFEEDLADKARVHGHLKAVIEVGEPLEVSPVRDRQLAVDPL
ncbi:MAG TPA: 1-acyl-sn-glycerol-3-phosphate acyltransferase, partial [Pirellulaceae bacterium]|nr:1-acyl-sn-glycerol-3-phosphate acyltransferase [Pirellulaceae bacterium]